MGILTTNTAVRRMVKRVVTGNIKTTLIGALALYTHIAAAQSSMEARVIGADGKAIANITVRAENSATGASFSGVSDAQGRVRFGGLATGGAWRLHAQGNENYVSTISDNVRLRSEFQSNITLKLNLRDSSQVDDEVIVTGSRSGALLNTSNAEVSATLSAEQIKLLPVEARSLERLLFRLPSVTQSTGFFGEAPSVAINGANALFTNYTIDGLDNNENFLGGQKFPVPVGAVQDVTVLSSSYSVEYGRTANGVVNVTTPSGGNEVKSEIFFVTRPGGFLSADPESNQTSLFGAPVSDSFDRYQGGFTVSGPIVKNQTFFFLNAEYVLDETDNILSAPLLNVNSTLEGTNEQMLITGRLDHNWNSQLRTSLRINHGHVELERQGGGLDGGVTFPSAGSVQDRLSTNIALTNTFSTDYFDYVGSFQYSRFNWDFGEPLNGPGPQASVFGGADQSAPIAVLGHPGFIFDSTEKTFQTQHKFTFDIDQHRIKFGTDLIVADFDLFGGGNVNGNFAVSLTDQQLAALQNIGPGLSTNDLPADANIISASFETQPNAFGTTQRVHSVFLEDQWQTTDNLSLTLGLRWDYDNLTSIGGSGDYDNFAPRFGFNFTPTETVAVRGGVGLFIEKIPYAVISDAIQQNSDSAGFRAQLQTLIDRGILPNSTNLDEITTGEGNQAINAAAQCTSLFNCPDPTTFANEADLLTNTERRIFNPSGLENPEALQVSLGVEWQANDDWLLGVDWQYSRGRNLLRLVDLNAPEPFVFNQAAFDNLGLDGVAALTPQQREDLSLVRSATAANLTRPAAGPNGVIPEGGARSIIVSDTGGRSRYRALIFKAQKAQGDNFYDASIFYTLSRLENDTDDINFRANDSNNFAADFGPSLNDRTHVIVSNINFFPIEHLTVSLAAIIQSGQPINLVPNATTFGTSDINGDGLSFADQFTGNPDRFPGVSRNSDRLPWSYTLDLGAGYIFEDLGSGSLEVRADFFNLLNTNNESGFPVNFTASNQIQVFGESRVQNSAASPRTFQFSAKYNF